ncbi:GIY-YIG nuclease family protein [Entomospira entomophila]|uniref:GIY-YIG nuclease family protein n=1 Tax=Entomospira entomophila TaxID=2719988 RepID=A0A968GAT6_9SPIO|nr:GIY-YIG nuclease family protein [Entomospira entomophilus]NIZ39986.1 GIY-YIG nuclease family protein [Entomospira entomophilus]WDI35546.1 GIY-YIG nuclease family protein [Entomospira entomophilus]
MGKTIKLFLVNDEPDGVAIAELSNWSGQLVRIPRQRLLELSHRTELQSTGIYFLFGVDENDQMMVYIGESDSVYRRLLQHYSDATKEFWQEAVAVVASKNTLNKADVRYLEELFYRRAKEANRYKVFNDKTPTSGTLSEADIDTLEKFAENVVLILGALSHKLFEPINIRKVVINPADQTMSEASPLPVSTAENNENLIYELRAKEKRGMAYGYPTNDGFLVLKGSYVDLTGEHSPYITHKVRQWRNELNGDMILKEDKLFPSPSAAAAFVYNSGSNGWTIWQTPDGRTLHDVVRANNQRIEAELDKQEKSTSSQP